MKPPGNFLNHSQSQSQPLIESSVTEPPQLSASADVNLAKTNMAPGEGLFSEQAIPYEVARDRSVSTRLTSSPMGRTAAFSEASPESQQWSAAVGGATLGKSGRVIDRLQGEIDRMNRDKRLLKARYDDLEKANETLVSRNQWLQDRNSNYEQSHEANERQLIRKDRQLEELRSEVQKERARKEQALEAAQTAAACEQHWREQCGQAKSTAAQKEAEYDVIVTCRHRDNDQHQQSLDKLRDSFRTILQQREEDVVKHGKLELLAEQQKKTIAQLQDLSQKLSSNFTMYRAEIDSVIAHLKENCLTHDEQLHAKLEEMTRLAGEMRWVLNVEKLYTQDEKTPVQPTSDKGNEDSQNHPVPTKGKEFVHERKLSSPSKARRMMDEFRPSSPSKSKKKAKR